MQGARRLVAASARTVASTSVPPIPFTHPREAVSAAVFMRDGERREKAAHLCPACWMHTMFCCCSALADAIRKRHSPPLLFGGSRVRPLRALGDDADAAARADVLHLSDVDVRFALYVHYAEVSKGRGSNSGKLLRHCFPTMPTFVSHCDDDERELMRLLGAAPRAQAGDENAPSAASFIILFPGQGAHPIADHVRALVRCGGDAGYGAAAANCGGEGATPAAAVEKQRPALTVLLLEGTWACARKLNKRLPSDPLRWPRAVIVSGSRAESGFTRELAGDDADLKVSTLAAAARAVVEIDTACIAEEYASTAAAREREDAPPRVPEPASIAARNNVAMMGRALRIGFDAYRNQTSYKRWDERTVEAAEAAKATAAAKARDE